MFLFPVGITGITLPLKYTADTTVRPTVQFTDTKPTRPSVPQHQLNQVARDPVQTAALHLKAAKENIPAAQKLPDDKIVNKRSDNIDNLPVLGPRFINRPHGRPLSAIIEQRSIASLRSKCSARFGSLHPSAMQPKPRSHRSPIVPKRRKPATKSQPILSFDPDDSGPAFSFPAKSLDNSDSTASSACASPGNSTPRRDDKPLPSPPPRSRNRLLPTALKA